MKQSAKQMMSVLAALNGTDGDDPGESIRGNIAMVLNARCHYVEDTCRSRRKYMGVRNFGIDDRIFRNVDTARGQEDFRCHVESVVSSCEPRLFGVAISIDRYEDGVLFFRISGIVRHIVGEQIIHMETELDTRRRTLKYKERAR